MKNRVIENWKTTVIGGLIVAGCIAFVLTDKATWIEVSGFLLASGLLAFATDPKKTK